MPKKMPAGFDGVLPIDSNGVPYIGYENDPRLINLKPIAPTDEAVNGDLAKALAKFGCDESMLLTTEDKTYNRLVKIWEESNGIPESIGTRLGKDLKMPETTVRSILARLARKGRVGWLRRGVWVPITQS